MPNHCSQDLYIYGPAKDRNSFLEAITVEGNEGKTETVICRTQLPMPNEIADTVSPVKLVATQEEADAINGKHSSPFGGSRNQAITRKRSEELIAKYGSNNWYDWANRNWGTKWGDYWHSDPAVTGSSTKLTFYSAWGPIDKALAEISYKWPTLTFKLRYYEGGNGFQGKFEVKNGEVMVDETKDYNGYRGG